MIYEIQLGRQSHPVAVTADGEGRYTVKVDDREYTVDLTEPQPDLFSMLLDGTSYEVGVDLAGENGSLYIYDQFFQLKVLDPRMIALRGKGGADLVGGRAEILSPMPGKVVKLLAGVGDEVATGQGLVVVEAMKMENELKSPKDGTVTEVLVDEGRAVDANAVLMVVE
jgi:biotin carboxyl carrier protein